MTSITEGLMGVRHRMSAAASRCGRDVGAVTLIAVSKRKPVTAIRDAYAAGQRHFGESRVQEAEEKVAQGLPEDIRLHLVGHLQSNKCAAAVRLFHSIQSVDSRALLERLDRHAAAPMEVLCQVDLAGEATKHGLPPDELPAFLAFAERSRQVRVTGLMCLPPYHPDPEQTRPYFRQCRELRDRCGGEHRLPELSMGMSHDFEIAIEEGATLVRVGQAIFGARESVP